MLTLWKNTIQSITAVTVSLNSNLLPQASVDLVYLVLFWPKFRLSKTEMNVCIMDYPVFEEDSK